AGSRLRVVLALPRPARATRGCAGGARRERCRAVRGGRGIVPLPAIHAGFWPAITRRQSPPSSLPRLPALAADECGLWLGARDPEARRHDWKGHGVTLVGEGLQQSRRDLFPAPVFDYSAARGI